MNKYLRGFINFIAKSVILFVGLAFGMNVLTFLFLFLPDLIIRVDEVLISNSAWWTSFVPGMLPLFSLFSIIAIAVLVIYKSYAFAKLFDVEKLIIEIKGKERRRL